MDFTTPKETGLAGKELELYELIWMRTVATQMKDSEQLQMSAVIRAENAKFYASGVRILFPGFLRAYVEGSDDVESALEDKETPLPELKVNDVVDVEKLLPKSRETKPPARYTEASLIQTMEKEGIGWPSTYAATVSTIIDRGYVRKVGNALTPTYMGMTVNSLMEKNFPDLVDVKFTAHMENYLDEIAEGAKEWLPYLKEFFSSAKGLETRVKQQDKLINPEEAKGLFLDGLDPSIQVKVGKFGPYIIWKKSPTEVVQTSIPESIAPADLSQENLEDLLKQAAKGPESLGKDPATGMPVYLKTGSYGPYLQLGDMVDEKSKPKRVSIPKGYDPLNVDLTLGLKILSLPRKLGPHPETGKDVVANLGRFGPYVSHNGEFLLLKKDDSVLDILLPRALELLAEPKGAGRGRGAKLLKNLGKHPGDDEPVQVMDGKYGPYVKHGKTNITIPKETPPDQITMEKALELLATKEGAVSVKKKAAPKARATKAKKIITEQY